MRKTTENGAKEHKGRFLGMLLGAAVLGNLLSGKGIIRAGEGKIREEQEF